MANYRKSFNLRNGVQVDNDNFIVNANGLVGIGTSIASDYLFNVYGDARITGLLTARNLYANNANVENLSVSKDVFVTGVVTASAFYGSASGLTGIYAIARDGWYINTANSSISTSYKVGIGNTNPLFSLQIGDPLDAEGIYFEASTGNIVSTGSITAESFTGSLDASNLTGTINNGRLPSTISVSSFVGNLTGTASTADSITNTANIQVNSINSGFSSSGISTVSTTLHVSGNIGVGTLNPNSQIHIRKSGISSIQLTSDGSNSSTITFGRSVNITSTSSNGQLRFGNTNGSYPDSTEQSVDIINYDTGNLNFYLNPGGSGTGSYNWFKSGLSKIMTLTSSGNLGINSNSPTSKLSVVGDANISGIVTVGILTATSIKTNSIRDKDGQLGSSNQVLTSTGSQIDWKTITDIPISGRIIQIIRETYSTQTNHTTTWGDTGLSTSITPSSFDSKIIILVNQPYTVIGGDAARSGSIRIVKEGSTVLYSPGDHAFASRVDGASGEYLSGVASLQYIDSPATTSEVTYSTQGLGVDPNKFVTQAGSRGSTLYSGTSQIYLIEIS